MVDPGKVFVGGGGAAVDNLHIQHLCLNLLNGIILLSFVHTVYFNNFVVS